MPSSTLQSRATAPQDRARGAGDLLWNPIVIIGAARSGTKFLRGLFGASAHCVELPYDLNHVWRMGCPRSAHDALAAEDCNDVAVRRIRNELVRLGKQFSRTAEADFVVEKTVSNTLRVALVNRVLPEAKLVHIVRDGRDVVESALRCWTAPPQIRYLAAKLRSFSPSHAQYAAGFGWNWLRGRFQGRQGVRVWGPRYPGIDQDLRREPLHVVCARQWMNCTASAAAALRRLPAERVATVRYEDLATDHATIDLLCEFAGLRDPDRVRCAYRATVTTDRLQRWRMQLPVDQQHDVCAEIGSLLADWGYG